MMPLVALGGLFMQPRTIVMIPPGLATIHTAVVPLPMETSSSVSVSSTTSSTAAVEIPPKVKEPTPKNSATSSQITADTKTKTVAKAAPPQPVSSSTPTALPKTITAQWLLDRTTVSLKQKPGGSYTLSLITNIGSTENLSWDLRTTSLGGNGLIPQFNVSFACNPPPDFPTVDSIDQNPSFQVRTSYNCNVSLTPLTGNDRRVQSKLFSFQTDPGQLIVTAATGITTILKDGENSGGFIFDNQDSKTLTITNLNIDASFTALTTSTRPLVIRFLDPRTDLSLFDYHLENLPADPTKPGTQSVVNAAVPLSFKIEPHTKKLLPIQALGVTVLSIPGNKPVIKVVLRGVTVDQTDVKTTLRQPEISWTCTVPTEAYNPYATSSVFMTGEVCR